MNGKVHTPMEIKELEDSGKFKQRYTKYMERPTRKTGNAHNLTQIIFTLTTRPHCPLSIIAYPHHPITSQLTQIASSPSELTCIMDGSHGAAR